MTREFSDMNEEEEQGPELVTDETIELLLRGAKALVIVVYVVVVITFAILTLGFFLHLAGASPEASFVDWVYRTTERAMQPFRGMFPVQDIDDRSVFDASLLFAAALYGFVAIGLHAVVVYLTAKARGYRMKAMSAPRQPAPTLNEIQPIPPARPPAAGSVDPTLEQPRLAGRTVPEGGAERPARRDGPTTGEATS